MKQVFLIILIINMISACTDVLNRDPQDEITQERFWQNANSLKLYLNQFYPSFGAHVEYYDMDSNSDNLQPLSPSEVLNGTRTVPGTGGGWNWENIRDINIYLQHAPDVTEGDQDELEQYLGEGYFFKAYFYFQLVKQFGNVPYYNKVLNINSEELQAPRDSRNEIIDHIIDNLDKSIDLLKAKSQFPAGRINRASALLFKSRVSLYEGTWEKYHAGTIFGVEGSTGEAYIQMAVKAAEELIESGNYGIYSTGHPEEDYWKLFSQTDLSNNKEAILSARRDPNQDLGSFAWSYLNGRRSWGTGLTKQFVDAYLDVDGNPISVSNLYKGDSTITQVVKNRDPRLEQTIWIPGTVRLDYGDRQVTFKYAKLFGSSKTSTGYMIRKGSTTDPEQNSGNSTAAKSDVDGFVFRYAEALLNYAEAKAELGTLTQADLDKTINLLRKRVGVDKLNIPVSFSDPNWNFPNLSPIINEIRRERRVELALEGFRYDDLMRWAAGDLIHGMKLKGARFIKGISFPDIEEQLGDIKVDNNRYIWAYKNSVPDGFGFNETRDYLFPIPTRQLTLNENLKQNPGWEQ